MANNPTKTTNYELIKPDVNDTYDIEEFHNASMDKIDKGLIERCRRGNGVPTGAGTLGDLYYNTGEKRFYQCTGGSTWEKIPTGMTYEAGTAIDFTNETVTGAKINVRAVTSVAESIPTENYEIPTARAVRLALEKKIDKNQGSTGANKVFITNGAGVATLARDLDLDGVVTKEFQVVGSSSLDILVNDPDGPVLSPDTKKVFYKSAVDANELATVGNVAAEKTARENADTAEASARSLADSALGARITAEENSREDADTTLQTNINTEASARATADTALQTAINAEVTRATGAENTLTINLANEITRSTDADNDHNNRLDSIEAGYLVKVETVNTSMAKDGKIKFTSNKTAESKEIGVYTGLTLDNNGLNVNEVKVINPVATAEDNRFPSEKATRIALDLKEDLVNKIDAPGSGDYEKHSLYPSLIFLRDWIIKCGNPSDTIPGDIVNDLLGGGTEGGTKKALSAAMGLELASRINDISTIGRYLSSWDAEEGKPGSAPQVDPYYFKSGDYYIVSKSAAAGSAWGPTGNKFEAWPGGRTKLTHAVNLNDTFRYDGTNWIHSSQTANDVYFYGIQGNPRDNVKLKTELSQKASGAKLSDGSMIYTVNPADEYFTINVGHTENNLVKLGGTVNTGEGILWDGTKFVSADLQKNMLRTTFQTNPDDTHYISEKLAYDQLYLKYDKAGGAISGDVTVGGTLSITGATTMSDILNMSNKVIKNLAAPTNDTDAANKKYVDDDMVKKLNIPGLATSTIYSCGYDATVTHKSNEIQISFNMLSLDNAENKTVKDVTIDLVTNALAGAMSPGDKTKLDAMDYMTDADINAIIGGW